MLQIKNENLEFQPGDTLNDLEAWMRMQLATKTGLKLMRFDIYSQKQVRLIGQAVLSISELTHKLEIELPNKNYEITRIECAKTNGESINAIIYVETGQDIKDEDIKLYFQQVAGRPELDQSQCFIIADAKHVDEHPEKYPAENILDLICMNPISNPTRDLLRKCKATEFTEKDYRNDSIFKTENMFETITLMYARGIHMIMRTDLVTYTPWRRKFMEN